MPRGKGTVYAGYCKECNARICSLRVLKSKNADFRKLQKYCKHCRKKVEIKRKAETHG
jgi:hypothetical protein